MKKPLMVLAALLPFAQAALAEPLSVNVAAGATVTLYGTIDAGVWGQSKATTDTGTTPNTVGPVNAGSVKRFHSGGISPSKWGLTGSKELKGGAKAIFTLEEHITAGTGATDAFGYSGFARQTFVGLTGDFGTVLLGEQFTPAILAFAATDPRGLRESMSGLQPWMFTTNFVNSTGTTVVSAFSHNSISYSKTVGGVNLAALYALGGRTSNPLTGNSSGGSGLSMGATYAGQPLTLSAGYQRDNDANGDKGSVKASVGAGYSIGPFGIKANYLNAKTYAVGGAPMGNYKVFGVGADWKATDQHNINVSYYSGKNDNVANNKGNSLVLSDEYAYDAGTTLYAQLGFFDAKAAADSAVTLLGQSNLVQGAKTTVINAGIRFNF
jgi:predicted porin